MICDWLGKPFLGIARGWWVMALAPAVIAALLFV